jgi:carbonic anhydrase/acetyltransferase-like protein (isoleucine patch superfamily)
MSTHIINFPGADIHTTTITSVSNVSVGENLDVTSNLTVSGDATVSQELSVSGNAVVSQELSVSGNAVVSQELSVSGNTALSSNLTVSGNVGIGTTEPTESLDIVGNLNLQKVSNTASIKLNSNVVTEYTRSKKLIKYPRVAMTQNALNNGYAAEASTENNGTSSGQAYRLFDGIAGGERGYHSAAVTYTSGSTYNGSASITDAYGTQHQGEWIKLQMPTADKIKLSGFSFSPRYESTAGYHHRAPYKGVFLGSTDGTNWYPIHYFDNVTVPELTTVSRTFENTTNDYYNRIALVVYEVGPNASYGDVLNFAEMELFGTPEYDPEAHGTDVIMRSVPNVPNTDWLEVYYDGQDYTSMPSTIDNKTGVSAYDATSINGVGFDATQKAFTFDANSSQYLSSSTPVSGNYIHTISMWFKGTNLTSTNGDTLMWIGDNTDNKRIEIYIENDRIIYNFKNNNVTAVTTFENDRWYHLTCTYNGTQGAPGREIYVDGQKITTSHSGNLADLNITNNTLNVGGYGGSSTTYMFSGFIANFRLFNRALTSDEVWQLYAYQKEYFDVSMDLVTFKNGGLGIGTSEPRAVLDVRGGANFDSAITIGTSIVSSFTGQHMCFPDGDMEQGLIVSANKNKYVSLNGVTTGLGAIRSDESLPIVSLSNVSNDGSVFGVVHELETGGTTRNRNTSGINTKSRKMLGDNRAVVNSLGEGAMWVANTNGNLVSGDYITSSNVAGYGQKQDDDFLHNYTVAKITMDCDFNPQEVPVQVIKEELDSRGRLQWEDHPTETEKTYKIRYLDTDGNITDEANAVHTAAFVGCTYHCG